MTKSLANQTIVDFKIIAEEAQRQNQWYKAVCYWKKVVEYDKHNLFGQTPKMSLAYCEKMLALSRKETTLEEQWN